MRNDTDNEDDVVERAMSKLTFVDGSRSCNMRLWKSLLDVFENEEDCDDNDGPPVLQLVSMPAVLRNEEPAPDAGTGAEGDADTPGTQ